MGSEVQREIASDRRESPKAGHVRATVGARAVWLARESTVAAGRRSRRPPRHPAVVALGRPGLSSSRYPPPNIEHFDEPTGLDRRCRGNICRPPRG
jgi:hypothetical protein